MADPEGTNPPLEPKLFRFHGKFQEKNGQAAQIDTPSADLNPQSNNLGSAPGNRGQYLSFLYTSNISWPVGQIRYTSGQFQKFLFDFDT